MKKTMIVVLMVVTMIGMFANVGKADRWTDDEDQKWVGDSHHMTYDEFVQDVVEGAKWRDVCDLVVIGNEIADKMEAEGYKMEATFEDRTVDFDGFRSYCMEVRTRVQIEEVKRMIDYAEWVKAGRPAGEK